MQEIALQLGVGGIFAVMLIREVLNYLTKRNGHRTEGITSGEKSVEFWHQEIEGIVREVFISQLLPELQRQTDLLKLILNEQQKISKEISIFIAEQRIKEGMRGRDV